MGVRAIINTDEVVEVVPGRQTSLDVTVANTAEVIDEFTLDVLGDGKEWITVEPDVLTMFPEDEEQVTLVFAPPEGPEPRAGEVSFALRVMSRERTEESMIIEGACRVAPVTRMAAEIVPKIVQGRTRARARVAVDNLGNAPMPVELFGTDPAEQLSIRPVPPSVVVEPGEAALVPVRVRPRRRFLRGPHRTLPYEVRVNTGQSEPITVEGTMVQQALLPRWAFTLLVALLVGAITLAVMWQTLFKPTLRSAARVAVAEQAQEFDQNVQQARTEASKAAVSAGQAETKASTADQRATEADKKVKQVQQATGLDGTGPSLAGTGIKATGPVTATDFRIRGNAPATSTAEKYSLFRYEAPAGKDLVLSDVVFQNAQGDSGVVQVRRGDAVLLESGLDNFRDLDFHFVQPINVPAGQPVILAVNCRNPDNRPCTPAAYFAGRLLG